MFINLYSYSTSVGLHANLWAVDIEWFKPRTLFYNIRGFNVKTMISYYSDRTYSWWALFSVFPVLSLLLSSLSLPHWILLTLKVRNTPLQLRYKKIEIVPPSNSKRGKTSNFLWTHWTFISSPISNPFSNCRECTAVGDLKIHLAFNIRKVLLLLFFYSNKGGIVMGGGGETASQSIISSKQKLLGLVA